MKRLVAAVVLGLVLSACGAVTAYNKDQSKSWTCVPNPEVVKPALAPGRSLAVQDSEKEKKPAEVAKK